MTNLKNYVHVSKYHINFKKQYIARMNTTIYISENLEWKDLCSSIVQYIPPNYIHSWLHFMSSGE